MSMIISIIMNKLACFLQFSLSANLRAVYIPFLLLNCTNTVITYLFFVLLVETPAHLSWNYFHVIALIGNAAITAHFKHCSALIFVFITTFFFVINFHNSLEELDRVNVKLWKLMCDCIKPFSDIRHFSTYVFICTNICCISTWRSLSSKHSAVMLLNRISTVIKSNLFKADTCGSRRNFPL